MTQLRSVLGLLSLGVISPACHDDACEVEMTAGRSKLSPRLVAQMETAADGASLPVVVTAVSSDALSCVSEAVLDERGKVTGPVGSQSILVSLGTGGIEAVASRADVQAIDPEFDDTPPP